MAANPSVEMQEIARRIATELRSKVDAARATEAWTREGKRARRGLKQFLAELRGLALAVQEPDLSGLLSNGVEALNRQTGFAWTSLSEEARLEALKAVERTPFFQRLRSDFVVYFYSNPAIWPQFGYEGPSNDKGGYLHRGFNDIDWIKREEL